MRLRAGSSWRRTNFRLNLTGFYQFYDRPQARIFVPFTLSGGGSFTSNSLSNLDEAVSYGFEAEMPRFSPIEGLDLTAGFTFLDTEIQQEEDPAVPQNAANFDGNPLPFASKYSAVMSARYEWALSEHIRAAISANGKYQTRFYLDAEGLEDRSQPAYGVVDAAFDLHFDSGWRAGLWARNINNADYAVSGFGFIGYNTFRSHPRSFGVSLRYEM